jgi:hypothetical protein
MQKQINKPTRPPTHEKRRGYTYIAPIVWDEMFWELWAKAPKRNVRKQYPQIKFFTRNGKPAKSSFYFLWHPREARFIRGGDYHRMADDHPEFLPKLEARLATEHARGVIPGTEVASNGQ